MTTKSDILATLMSEYKEKLRQDGDISLSDFRDEFKRTMGVPLGEKRARKMLAVEVDAGRMVSLIVLDNGRDVQIWRAKNADKTRGARRVRKPK